MNKQFLKLALCVFLLPMSAVAQELELIDGEGVVQEVSVATGAVTIAGITYRVEAHADVNIGGLPSSVAGLQAGMKVSFLYADGGGFEGVAALQEPSVIHELEQLPDSYVIEEF